jgi:hypothetical protein
MKSAVEFLEEIIYSEQEFSLSEVFEQAKEMEKQQIIKARTDIYITGNLSAEQYYNETFKQQI